MNAIHVYPPSDGDGTRALINGRDQQRRLRDGSTLVDPVEILIHAGTYRIGSPIELTTLDFGSIRAPVTWKSAGDGPVVLSGAHDLEMRRQENERIWSCQIQPGTPVHGLLDGDQWMRTARYPNARPGEPWFGGWLLADEPPAGSSGNRRRFWCRDAGLSSFATLIGAEVVVFPRANYRSDRRKIISYDPETGEIQLDGAATYDIGPDQRFYIQGVSEVLDSSGEWRHDPTTGLIECLPISIGKPSISMLGSRHIFDIQGNAKKAADVAEDDWPYWDAVLRQIDPPEGVVVSHLTFRDFICEGTIDAAIKVESCAAVTIQGCTIRRCGARGIRLIGGESCRIADCEISDIAGGAILVAGGVRRPFTAVSEPGNHRISNCYIHHTGLTEKHTAAVAIAGVGNVCEHCLIHDVPRWGIHSRGDNHRLEYNHIRHMSAETSETAGIFLCDRDWQYRGTVIRFNHIHDIPGFPPEQAPDSFRPWAYGIYLDDWTSGVIVESNIVSNTSHSGLLINSGHSNAIVNNIVSGTFEEGIRIQRRPAVFELERMGTVDQGLRRNRFERNLVCASNPDQRVYTLDGTTPEDFAGSDHGNVWDRNLVWNAATEVRIDVIAQGQRTSWPWSEWVATSGQDTSSIVADPLLGDVEFPSESSRARALGFVPIPVDQIGLIPSDQRSDWPPPVAPGMREVPIISQSAT